LIHSGQSATGAIGIALVGEVTIAGLPVSRAASGFRRVRHSSTSTTQHYAHLAPDFFGPKAFEMVAVDLTRPTGNVVDFARSGCPLGQRMGREQEFTEEQDAAKSA